MYFSQLNQWQINLLVCYWLSKQA